ncbi:MAG: hypothetical protein ABEJ98_03360 [Candidatus Nanohaloarchaea archaeon]
MSLSDKASNFKNNVANRVDVQKPEITGDDKVQEKIVKYSIQHKLKVSVLSIILMIFAFIFRLPPFSLIFLLPGWIGEAVLLFVAAQLVAFYPARVGYRAFKSANYDLIFAVNPGDKRRVKMYQFAKGLFSQQYEFRNGRPLSWENNQGINCYLVIELDRDENVAYCPWLGDLDTGEILAFEDAWEKQRLKNDEERAAGTNIRMRAGQIASKIKARVSNAWIRDLQELEFDEKSRDSMADVLPDEITEDIDVEEDLLEDLEKNADQGQKLEIVDRGGEES